MTAAGRINATFQVGDGSGVDLHVLPQPTLIIHVDGTNMVSIHSSGDPITDLRFARELRAIARGYLRAAEEQAGPLLAADVEADLPEGGDDQ